MIGGIDDPVLVRLRVSLDQVYGTQTIDRVVLFGSGARGMPGRMLTMKLQSS